MEGHQGHRFHPDKADKLLNDERKESLPFDKVIEIMDLGPHDVVADLGAGNGYFTIPIANHTKGTVYAIDIEPKMLEILKKRANDERIENIRYVISDIDHTQIEDQSIDQVLISWVLHEVPSIENTLTEIKRILKPGGTVLFIEWEAIETEDGPPFHIRIPSEKLVQILENDGFETTLYRLNPVNYALKGKLS